MKRTIASVVVAVALAMSVFTATSGAWTSYYGPASMGGCGSCVIAAASNSNYWTNNRVYRPIGYGFQLGYDNGTSHWSTTNSTDNPFYFPAYGYNYIWCYYMDSSTVSPVTCQGNA